MAGQIEFAVVDVETTGFSARAHDRIVEVAVIRTDGNGNQIAAYHTLVNPERDVGASHVHGLSGSDVMDAPRFREICGDVLDILSGAVFVAHNVHFDMRFVRSEALRAGIALPEFPYLCTMQLARQADPCVGSRRLRDLCTHFGVRLVKPHCALDDANACLCLLRCCMDRMRGRGSQTITDLGVKGRIVDSDEWPALIPSGKAYTRADARSARHREVPFLARLVHSLPPASAESPAVDEYLALLDRVLEDRRVTESEADELRIIANELGLSGVDVESAHRSYMAQLIKLAWRDGVVTEAERRDLEDVRRLLCLSPSEFDIVPDAPSGVRERRTTSDPANSAITQDVEGKTVCFTGAMLSKVEGNPASRATAERLAEAQGMIVKEGVSKHLDYLVAPDPDSLSGKATKARCLGVRIIAEPVFWRMIGVDVG